MTAARPTAVLVYQRVSLPWIFEAADRAGIDLVLVPRPDERVPDRLPPAVVDVLRLDLDDGADAVERLRRHRRHFDGIVTLYDPAVPFVAEAAEALGLPGIGAATARAAQDKRVMRERFAAAGLNVPRFVRLDGPEAPADTGDLAYPVVVKPAHGYSSLGVVRVDDPAGLDSAVAEVRRVCRDKLDRAAELVVEEYLDGPEYAVESLAHRGEVEVLTVGYKGEPKGPYFEETVYRAPARLPAETVAAIEREVAAGHAALGLTEGPAHTELRLRDGRPHLLEIGARVGGSGVSHYIAHHAVGADLAADALRLAVGLEPEPPHRRAGAAGAAANYIVPCGGSGRIRAIGGLDEVRARPEVDHLVQMLHPGDVVRPYPDFTGYPAFVLSSHASDEEAERFHRHLDRAIRIDYEPDGPG
ncbi:ATP-grasp domain-containing protein [Glycomyces halotolerans]